MPFLEKELPDDIVLVDKPKIASAVAAVAAPIIAQPPAADFVAAQKRAQAEVVAEEAPAFGQHKVQAGVVAAVPQQQASIAEAVRVAIAAAPVVPPAIVAALIPQIPVVPIQERFIQHLQQQTQDQQDQLRRAGSDLESINRLSRKYLTQKTNDDAQIRNLKQERQTLQNNVNQLTAQRDNAITERNQFQAKSITLNTEKAAAEVLKEVLQEERDQLSKVPTQFEFNSHKYKLTIVSNTCFLQSKFSFEWIDFNDEAVRELNDRSSRLLDKAKLVDKLDAIATIKMIQKDVDKIDTSKLSYDECVLKKSALDTRFQNLGLD